MIVTPTRSTYKAVTAVKGENGDRPRSFADLMGAQARGKANDNPAIAITRNVPKDRNLNGQFFDELA